MKPIACWSTAIACLAAALTLGSLPAAAAGPDDGYDAFVGNVECSMWFDAAPEVTTSCSDHVSVRAGASGSPVTGFDTATVDQGPLTGGLLGTAHVTITWDCLQAIGNMVIARWHLSESDSPLFPEGTHGMSIPTDGAGTGEPDADRVLFGAPPPLPGVTPCSLLDKELTFDMNPQLNTVSLVITKGSWVVHDGVPNY